MHRPAPLPPKQDTSLKDRIFVWDRDKGNYYTICRGSELEALGLASNNALVHSDRLAVFFHGNVIDDAAKLYSDEARYRVVLSEKGYPDAWTSGAIFVPEKLLQNVIIPNECACTPGIDISLLVRGDGKGLQIIPPLADLPDMFTVLERMNIPDDRALKSGKVAEALMLAGAQFKNSDKIETLFPIGISRA